MQEALQTRLDPVRRRQQWARSIRFSVWGLLASAGVILALAVGRIFATGQISAATLAAVALVGPALAFVISRFSRPKWQAAARAVDGHYQLKDRATTALDFLSRSDATNVHRLAVDDALAHLSRVNPREVVPLRSPRALPCAVAALIAAIVVVFMTSPTAEVNAGSREPIAVVVAQAERLADELEPLEEFAKEQNDPEIEKLVAQIQQAIEELKQPEVDLREALAKLSEMEAALQQQQAKYNVEAADAEFKAIGEALSLAQPLAPAGKALSGGQLDKAAEELDKLEAPQLDRQTEKAMKEKLDELAKQMQDAGNNSLSQAAGDISAGLGGNSSRFKEGTQKLAGEAKKQSKRKKLQDLLHKQCQCLSECKGECESECKSESNKPGGKRRGTTASGNQPGDATPNVGGKQEMRLSGKQSEEGDVEIETSHSTEGKEQARRSYRETYEKYRKISDAVLESEPIPLGHRQTIRRYFESIRPQEAETEKAADEAP